MNSIVFTYPYFQALPKGLKMMLIESEGFFYQQGHAAQTEAHAAAYTSKATRMDVSRALTIPTLPLKRPTRSDSHDQRAFPE
jgi:hypothetical protein